MSSIGTTSSQTIVFSKGAIFPAPTAGTVPFAAWVAPFACTILSVEAFQDVGTGSVVNVLDETNTLLTSNISISTAGAWQPGTLAQTTIAAGDTIYMQLVSVGGTPNFVTIQIDVSMVLTTTQMSVS